MMIKKKIAVIEAIIENWFISRFQFKILTSNQKNSALSISFCVLIFNKQ
jgi:hypothetical protein